MREQGTVGEREREGKGVGVEEGEGVEQGVDGGSLLIGDLNNLKESALRSNVLL